MVQANLHHLWRDGGPLILLFMLAVAVTMFAGVLALLTFTKDNELSQLVPVLVATYIGGSVNFVAASQSLAVEQPELVAAALAADAVVGISYLVVLAAASGLAALNYNPDTNSEIVVDNSDDSTLPVFASLPISLAAAAFIVAVAQALVWWTELDSLFYLFIITLSVLIANAFPAFLGRLTIAPKLGVSGMYLFFAVIGGSTQLSAISTMFLPATGLAAFIVIVHALLFFIIGRILKKDFATLITVSNACILGPATAAAVASSRGWSHLVALGTLCGVLGYVIANFLIILLFPLLT
ncbi:conserved hypothetical protein [Luminiphilus syltensis NOR5-1B]|uniref:DUF819 family protein n=1 Tax=Luminiphilus syltensis NOR5-1B TaxID=565045 RepID=B8KVM6_9GAMM|nr:conserved hypothetical protein [Luminiphilus syltensis NOR5-1B]